MKKLKSRETGVIGELIYEPDKEYHFTVATGDALTTRIYKKIADLYEDWEDYEEPKEYWYIDCDGEVMSPSAALCSTAEEDAERIGNIFNAKEEAELAVRKLKAWKRLKDKGFEFCCDIKYESLCGNGFNIPLNAIMPPEAYTDTEVSKDLDLLFGGEE